MATNQGLGRVQFAGLERSRFNGKLAVQFDIYNSRNEYVIGKFTSAHMFRSFGAAFAGAKRAAAVVAETGKFPNMCEWF